MFSGLLSLALVGTALSVVSTTEALLVPASFPDLRIGSAQSSLPTMLIRPGLLCANAERDCIDDSDNSDESSSGKQRTEEFGKSMRPHALERSRTRLEPSSPTPQGPSLPLFYVFCTLLI